MTRPRTERTAKLAIALVACALIPAIGHGASAQSLDLDPAAVACLYGSGLRPGEATVSSVRIVGLSVLVGYKLIGDAHDNMTNCVFKKNRRGFALVQNDDSSLQSCIKTMNSFRSALDDGDFEEVSSNTSKYRACAYLQERAVQGQDIRTEALLELFLTARYPVREGETALSTPAE